MGNKNKGQVKKDQRSVLNLIWVDGEVRGAQNEGYKKQFKYMFNYCFYFDSIELYEVHFQEYAHNGFEKYFVIVSEEFVERIMTLANEQIMVESVFIHSDGVEDENEPNVVDDHQKIQCVDDDLQKIIQQIKNTGKTQSHVSLSYGQEFHFIDQGQLMNSLDIEYIMNFTFKNEESIEIAIKEFGQFSIEYIEKFYIDPTEQLLQDENLQSLVNYFYQEEANSKVIQAFVEEESFFYKMLNHVINEGDLVNLFFIRAGLYILQQQINHYSETDTFKLPKLYWGTYMAKHEFEIWQIDRKPFMFYGYFITTSNRQQALKHIDLALNNIPLDRQGSYVKLLIEININYENEDQQIGQPICLGEISKIKNLDDYLLHPNQLVLCKEVKLQKNLGYAEIITELSNFRFLKHNFHATVLERKQQIDRMLNYEYPIEHFYIVNFLSVLGKGDQMLLVLERLEELEDEVQQVNKLNYIGIAYYLNGQYDKALENHEKALEIQRQNFGPDHPDSAATLNNMGSVYSILGRSNEALESFQKTLQIQKYSKGEFDECLSVTYNNIAAVYKNMGELDKSLEYFEQALMVKKSAFDHYNTSIAIAYSNIGTIYYTQQQYRKSVEYFVKALQIQEQLMGETHHSIAIYYTNIAVGFIKLDLNKKALQYLQKSLQINIQATGEQSLNTAKSYIDIALYYKNNEQKQNSINNYHDAYQIMKLYYSENHPQLTNIIDQINSLT